MMNIINNTGMPGMGLGIIWLHTHFLFGGVALVGLILFIVWSVKYLSKGTLKSLTMWLLAVGVIGTILTAIPAMNGFQNMMNSMFSGGEECQMMDKSSCMNMPMMQQMMKGMMQNNEGDKSSGHEDMQKMMDMNDPAQINQ